MFENNVEEIKGNILELSDIPPKTLEHLISYLYCGRFRDSSWIQSLPQLANASEKVESLKKHCDSHLIQGVTLRNALALGKLAERHGLKKASDDIRAYLAQNSKEVTMDTEFDTNDLNFKLCYFIPETLAQISSLTGNRNMDI